MQNQTFQTFAPCDDLISNLNATAGFQDAFPLQLLVWTQVHLSCCFVFCKARLKSGLKSNSKLYAYKERTCPQALHGALSPIDSLCLCDVIGRSAERWLTACHSCASTHHLYSVINQGQIGPSNIRAHGSNQQSLHAAPCTFALPCPSAKNKQVCPC